jgi:nicotinamide phosphoribosyltransferase
MLPKNTTRIMSNFTPRASRIAGQKSVVVIGHQYVLRKYLMEAWVPFFAGDIDAICAKFTKRVNGYLGPDQTVGEDHIRALHALGYLPLEFRALPEGTHVPLRVPSFILENTHDDFAWLTNYFETLLSCVLWGPATSATAAFRFRKVLDMYARRTGSPIAFVDWQGHDFSMRGMWGPEAAALSGLGHLLFFTGTDTLPALDLIDEYYSVPEGYLVGGSVQATEHMVMCLGTKDGESEAYRRLLTDNPTGVLSIVSDTWDLWNVLTNIVPSLKGLIMSRAGKLTIRPDSGDPVKIICGDKYAPKFSPEWKGVIRILWETFGGTYTETGHMLLDSHVGAVYGDSITEDRLKAILAELDSQGYASANMVLGIGSFTYTYVTRDTYGWAMKATSAVINGKQVDLFKDPVTDDGTKKSAKGRLAVLRDAHDELYLVNQATPEQEAASEIRPIWRDGKFLIEEGFDVIRARARSAA